VRRPAAALVWIVLAGQPVLGQDGSRACPVQTPDTITAITGHGDLVLARNGPLALAGIRLPEDGAVRDRSLAWLRERTGGPAWTTKIYQRDRWGRTVADVAVQDEGACLDLADGLIRQGLALWDPGPFGIVHPVLRSSEAAARKRSLGLWSDDRYKALTVRQVDRMRERIGRFVLVEGRVRSVGERRARAYLNFGSDWTSDFTLIIPKRTWSTLAARGLTAATLKGRRIRARGILEDWQGPALTVTVPEMIEALENER
jgi:endonuclease YncB( thermonuclease family)